jgi:hypothetical protein
MFQDRRSQLDQSLQNQTQLFEDGFLIVSSLASVCGFPSAWQPPQLGWCQHDPVSPFHEEKP